VLLLALETDLVVPTTTPGLAVGSVTESASVCAAALVCAAWLVVTCCTVGHRASNIPPPLIMPSKVFELTMTFEQAWVTLLASASNEFSQAVEQPSSPKSATTQLGICWSYENWQVKGISIEVISWKFASERALAKGSHARRIACRRMLCVLSARRMTVFRVFRMDGEVERSTMEMVPSIDQRD